MQLNGYWVRKDKILDMDDYHIHYIIQNPIAFGLTEKIVQDKYSEYDERIGLEGKARQDLIIQATSSGWVRVRHYVRPDDYWSIQCDDIDKRLPVIYNFITNMINLKLLSEGHSLVLIGFNKGEKRVFNFMNGGAKAFLDTYKYPTSNMIMKKYSKSYLEEMAE